MAAGSRSGVYRALLCRLGLSPMVMIDILKSGLPQLAGKGLLKQ